MKPRSWTIFYDTCYGMMDKKDDVKVGIKSTALRFGGSTRLILALFAAAAVAGLAAVGIISQQQYPFFVLSVGGAAGHLAYQVITIDFDNPKSCLACFVSNGTQLGYIVWTGLLVNYVHSVRER